MARPADAALDCAPRSTEPPWPAAKPRFVEITPEVLLKAYACGIFPMAESADDPALYLDRAARARRHPARCLPRSVAAGAHRARRRFRSRSTATSSRDRRLRRAAARPRAHLDQRAASANSIGELFDIGHCHTVEVYDGDALVGGLYGVSLGRAFFGESMFHRARDASKIALVHLVARLRAGGFALLDTQFVTEHLKTFGAAEVPRRRYHKLLEAALVGEADFAALTPRHERRARRWHRLRAGRSSG